MSKQNNIKKIHTYSKLISLVTLFFLFFQLSFLWFPTFLSSVFAAVPFTTAYTTLSNSRLSVVGKLYSTVANTSAGIPMAVTSQPDNDTQNIFNGDTVCFNNAASNGCHQQTNYTVNNILTNSYFSVSAAVGGSGLLASDRIIASQSARLSITFRPSDVTNLNQLRILIPAVNTGISANDGMPDQAKFDAVGVSANIAQTGVFEVSGGSIALSGTPSYSVTSTGGNYFHTLLVGLSQGTLNTSTDYTITIGHGTSTNLRFINPAPATTHVRGRADSNVITLISEDVGGNDLNQADMGVAPNDGVFVTAYVPTSVSWVISGVAGAETHCGSTTSVTTTATSVPFGTIFSTDTFFNAAQRHTVTTNASGGYTLSVTSNGALSRNGTTPVIANGACDGSCTVSSAGAWATASNNGFGYTLANVTGTDAAFTNANGYRIFDVYSVSTEATYNLQLIASNAGVAYSKQVDVCYRLSVGSTQQSGFYYNKITYVATPKF